MENFRIVKGGIVKNTDPEMLEKGIVAFQMVNFIIDFYGSETESPHDTRIMDNGRQFVIDGCGFIPPGYEIKD
jgi:hypothetical protein